MAWPTIVKIPSAFTVTPNLGDYESVRASFSWAEARRELAGLPGGGLNIAYEAIDRHAAGPRRDHLALRWLGKRGETEDYTYGQKIGPTDPEDPALLHFTSGTTGTPEGDTSTLETT